MEGINVKENKKENKESFISVKVYKLEGKKPAGTDTPWYLQPDRKSIDPKFITGETISNDKEAFIVSIQGEDKEKVIITDGTAGHMDYSYDFTEMKGILKSRATNQNDRTGTITPNHPEGEMLEIFDEKGDLINSFPGNINFYNGVEKNKSSLESQEKDNKNAKRIIENFESNTVPFDLKFGVKTNDELIKIFEENYQSKTSYPGEFSSEAFKKAYKRAWEVNSSYSFDEMSRKAFEEITLPEGIFKVIAMAGFFELKKNQIRINETDIKLFHPDEKPDFKSIYSQYCKRNNKVGSLTGGSDIILYIKKMES